MGDAAAMSVLAGIDALLFDLGGVLIRVHFERCLEHWARSAGVCAADLGRRFHADAAYRRLERGQIDFPTYAAALRARLRVDLDDDQLLEGWNALLGDAYPDAHTIVQRAAALRPSYLFSNSNAAHQACWQARHEDLLAPFRRLFVSSELGLRKPDPEAFLLVAQAMDAPPSRILFFDDSEQNVSGARAAGLNAIRVSDPRDVASALGLGI